MTHRDAQQEGSFMSHCQRLRLVRHQNHADWSLGFQKAREEDGFKSLTSSLRQIPCLSNIGGVTVQIPTQVPSQALSIFYTKFSDLWCIGVSKNWGVGERKQQKQT